MGQGDACKGKGREGMKGVRVGLLLSGWRRSRRSRPGSRRRRLDALAQIGTSNGKDGDTIENLDWEGRGDGAERTNRPPAQRVASRPSQPPRQPPSPPRWPRTDRYKQWEGRGHNIFNREPGLGRIGRWDGTHEAALSSAGGVAAVASASAAAAATSMASHRSVQAVGRTGM